MKALRFPLFLMMAMLIFNSCRKDNSGPSSADPKPPMKIEDLTVKSTFDWKTVIDYKITLTSQSNHSVIFVTPSGSVNRKYFLTANSPFTVTLSFPAYEKTIHLLFNGHDVELPLTSTVLSYTFNY
jgi:hypothetical protein